jgi:transposase-like protein
MVSESKNAVPVAASAADSEIPAKAQRRIFTAEEKKRILEETDRALANGGGVGAILRREGIYSSTLHGWRKERDRAVHKAFSQKRGPQSRQNPLAAENEKLRRQNQRLQEELEKAHIIIDVQEKLMFKKKWPSYWVTRSRKRRNRNGRGRSTRPAGGCETSLPGVGGAASQLVPAAQPSSFSPARGRVAVFTSGFDRSRTASGVEPPS